MFYVRYTRMYSTNMKGVKWWIMFDINVSISNLEKSYQDYISIANTLHLGISKCCLLRLESCYHSSDYLLSTFAIIYSIWLIIIFVFIDPYWWTSFFNNFCTPVGGHACAKLSETSTHIGVSSASCLGVRIAISPLFDKLFHYILDLDIDKDT